MQKHHRISEQWVVDTRIQDSFKKEKQQKVSLYLMQIPGSQQSLQEFVLLLLIDEYTAKDIQSKEHRNKQNHLSK